MYLEFHALLEEVPNHEVVEFLKGLGSDLSSSTRKECYSYLIVRWAAEKDPGEALTALIKERLSERGGLGTILYRSLASQWAYRDPAAMAAWLGEHWNDVAVLQKKEFGGVLLEEKFAQTVMDAFESREGVEAALHYLEAYPLSTQKKLVRNLSGGGLRGMDVESAEALYAYLKNRTEDPDWRRISKEFMINWAVDDLEGMKASLEKEAPADRFWAQLQLLGKIRPRGQTLERYDGASTTSFIDDTYVRLLEREQAAFESGVAAGFSTEETIAQIADELLVGRWGLIFEKTFFGNTAALNNVEVQKERQSFLERVSSPNLTRTAVGPVHGALLKLYQFSDDSWSREFAVDIMKQFVLTDPKGAKAFVEARYLPEHLRAWLEHLSNQ